MRAVTVRRRVPGLTLAAPTPAGMSELTPEVVPPPEPSEENCDRTASLPPFPDKAQADAAVANIRNRGRLIVGLDIGSNLFSFRDPITGEITGFDVDIAGEVARDIFGTPTQVEYRILSSADRITALQNDQVDIVVKTMTITCARRRAGELLDGVSQCLPTHSGAARFSDQPGVRPVWSAGVFGRRHHLTQADPTDHACPDHHLGGDVGRLPGCGPAAPGRRGRAGKHTILAGLASQDPFLHIVGPSAARSPTGSA